jgi:hypothetical protein
MQQRIRKAFLIWLLTYFIKHHRRDYIAVAVTFTLPLNDGWPREGIDDDREVQHWLRPWRCDA